MTTLFTFPGQGSQYTGMLHQLPKDESTRQLIEQASDELKQDVLRLDSESALRSTYAVQIALLISGVAYARHLISEGVIPDFVCGLSIGAYPAAVISGALNYKDALNLVALRATLMEQAYPQGYGLAAIVGLTYPKVESMIQTLFSPLAPLYIANFNTETQLVVAGESRSLEKIMALAKANGAQKTAKLKVSVPSHCYLLQHQAEQLAKAFQSVTLNSPIYRYLSSNQARVLFTPEKIANDLAFNMARAVHFDTAMQAAKERGVSLIIEMPPGSVLTGLAHQNISSVPTLSIQNNGIKAAVYKFQQLSTH